MENLSSLSQEINLLHADICSALADPTRILILYMLADKPYTVNDLVAGLGATQSATSRHLKVLRDRGLVRATRQGQNVEYALNDPRVVGALDTLRAVLRDTLERRANLVAE
ncbi:MAG: ArsR/SmtB family transcription factor [Chloroflexota bacterium]